MSQTGSKQQIVFVYSCKISGDLGFQLASVHVRLGTGKTLEMYCKSKHILTLETLNWSHYKPSCIAKFSASYFFNERGIITFAGRFLLHTILETNDMLSHILCDAMQIPCVLAAWVTNCHIMCYNYFFSPASQYIFPMKWFESYELCPYFSLKETNH